MHGFNLTPVDEVQARQKFDKMSATKQHNSLKRKQKYYENMRWEVARIIDCNFDSKTKFLTLTFKENKIEISETNVIFKKFIKRLNYHLFQTKKQRIKYLATWEKQKRGAIHYHIIFFDFPYIEKLKLQEMWGQGFIKINKVDVDSKDNRGRYVSKYFSKDLDLKEHKKKAFFRSQNLRKPIVTKTILTNEMIDNLAKENIIFTKHYNRHIYMGQGSETMESPVFYMKIRKEVAK